MLGLVGHYRLWYSCAGLRGSEAERKIAEQPKPLLPDHAHEPQQATADPNDTPPASTPVPAQHPDALATKYTVDQAAPAPHGTTQNGLESTWQ